MRPICKRMLAANGYDQTEVISPTSDNAYGGLGELAGPFVRTGWRGLVAADILQKMLLRYAALRGRPRAPRTRPTRSA